MSEKSPRIEPGQTEIPNLGPAKIPNPIAELSLAHESFHSFVPEGEGVITDPFLRPGQERTEVFFEHAGPREYIYFDPSKLKAAIVTCGGMCPGINSLIRAIVLQLHHIYGVRNIVGVRYGLQGFIPSFGHDLMELNPGAVHDMHGRGGSFLGMSRGGQPIEEVVDTLERQNVSVLFMIGGDGTLHAAKEVFEEISARGLKTGVVAIPRPLTMTSATWNAPLVFRPRWKRRPRPSWAPITRPPARPTELDWSSSWAATAVLCPPLPPWPCQM